MRTLASILIALFLYEIVARSGWFAAALVPTLPAIARTLWGMLADGTMENHALATLGRVFVGLSLAAFTGLVLGFLMARYRPVERFCSPLVSALMPIPSLAWAPVFILWFGLGNVATILIVFYASTFPMLINTWTGARAVNPLWLRAARTQISFTAFTPVQVLRMTGKAETNATSTIEPESPRPNHSRKSGA